MADPIQGILELQSDPGGLTRIVLDPNTADITAGGNGETGELILSDASGDEVVRIGRINEPPIDPGDPTVDYSGMRIRTPAGVDLVEIGRTGMSGAALPSPDDVGVLVGGTGFSGTVRLIDKNASTRLVLGRDDDGNEGRLAVVAASGETLLEFNPDVAGLYVGGQGNEGDVIVRDAANAERIKLDAGEGDIRVRDAAGNTLMLFDSGVAALYVGGQGNEGDVVVRDAENKERIKLDGGAGDILVRDATGNPLMLFDSGAAALYVGGTGNEGDVIVRDAANKERIKLDGGEGDIRVRNAAGDTLMHFDSGAAAMYVGGTGNEGDVIVRDAANKERIRLDGGEGDIRVRNAAGSTLMHFDSGNAALYVGGQGNEGDVVVRDAANRERIKLDAGEGDILVRNTSGNTLMHFDSEFAALYVGGTGNEGDVVVRDAANKERIKLDAGEGDIIVRDGAGNPLMHFDSAFAALYVGGVGNEGDVVVRNEAGVQTIKLDGGLGDIILSNADCAEEFDVSESVIPGTVMVIGDDERLMPCSEAYDRRVAGVVSGAGPYRPGIVLDRRGDGCGRPAVALVGKVYCQVDSAHGAIRVGDLLVSSPTPGHAMVAKDSTQWPGAVLGKALRGWTSGQGLIPILVTLQ